MSCSWWKRSENKPVIYVALTAGVLSVLASLLWVAYLRQAELGREAAANAERAEAAAATARQAANKGERAREQGEDLVKYIMKDLRDSLVPMGRADVLESISAEALTYFESLPPDLITSESENQRALIFVSLAGARENLGDREGSIEAHGKAIKILRALHQNDVTNAVILDDLAHALNERGFVFVKMGRLAEARAGYREVLSLYEGNEEGNEGRLGTAELGLAEVEQREKNAEGAFTRYGKAALLFRNAIDDVPGSKIWHQLLGLTYNNAGLLASRLGRFDEAEGFYRQSLEVMRRLITLEPENRNWEKELASLLNNLGCVFDGRGEFEKAEPFFREALALRQGLVSWDPNNMRWLSNLANAWHNEASIHFRRGQAEEMLSAIRRAQQVFQKLLVMDPENSGALDDMLRFSRINQDRLKELKRTDDAVTLAKETAEFVASLKSGKHESLRWTQALGGLQTDLGNLKAASGTNPIEQYVLAAKSYAAGVDKDASQIQALRLLTQSYLDLGKAYRDLGEQKKAASFFGLARKIVETLVTEKSGNFQLLLDFATREERLALGQVSVLVNAGSKWRYWDRAEFPGEDWASPSFDDHDWSSGLAPLGYGNGDEATEVDFGREADDKNPTVWFRHEFEINDPGALKELEFHLQRDDGAVVYLNGHEIMRSGLAAGTLLPTTFARHTSKGFDEVVFHLQRFDADELPLKKGKNLLAVEIHQNEAISSDLRMDLAIWEVSQKLGPPSLEGIDPDLIPAVLAK